MSARAAQVDYSLPRDVPKVTARPRRSSDDLSVFLQAVIGDGFVFGVDGPCEDEIVVVEAAERQQDTASSGVLWVTWHDDQSSMDAVEAILHRTGHSEEATRLFNEHCDQVWLKGAGGKETEAGSYYGRAIRAAYYFGVVKGWRLARLVGGGAR